jgi:hypothetical protein
MRQKPGSHLLHTLTIYRLYVNIHFLLEVTACWLNLNQLLIFLPISLEIILLSSLSYCKDFLNSKLIEAHEKTIVNT